LRVPHPDANERPDLSWAESKSGLAYKKAGLDFIPYDKKLVNGALVKDDTLEKASTKFKKGTFDKSNNIALLGQIHDTMVSSPFMTLMVNTSLSRKDWIGWTSAKTCLMDTGALDANYVSSDFLDKLQYSLGHSIEVIPNDTVVNTPFENVDPIHIKGTTTILVKIFNEISSLHEILELEARVIDSSIDVIIGRPSIRDNSLLRKCHDGILKDTRESPKRLPRVIATFYENDLWLNSNMIQQQHQEINDPNMGTYVKVPHSLRVNP
jgi:hypothetical protein